jgi:hypothetical protein
MNKTIELRPDHISLERYVMESSFVTKYLSRIVKDKALVVYQVLFHLAWFETGKGVIIIPWARVGSYIRSEQRNIIDNNTTVKRRLSDLFEHKCISVNRQRGGANEISVSLPSDIASCRQLIDKEIRIEPAKVDQQDYFNNLERRLVILSRDHQMCVYCTAALSEENFVLDHLMPVARGGTNKKHNLVVACEVCNRRRGEIDPVPFLRENYRQQLLTQDEFLRQKEYIEALLVEDFS